MPKGTTRRFFIEGVKGGLALATVECALRSIVSPLAGTYVTPQYLWVILGPFVFYALLLGIECFAIGFFIDDERRNASLTATAAVTALVSAATFRLAGSTTRIGVVAVSLVLFALAVASIVSPRLERQTRPLTPASVSIVLIGILWLLRDVLSRYSHRERTLIAAIAVVALSAAFVALRRRAIGALSLGATCAVATVVMTGAVLVERSNEFHGASTTTGRQRLPNVILISLDTVRADHTSVYGYSRNTTPALAAFARSATTFRNAIASSNYTLPSHTSMFTGLYAGVHGNYEPDTGETLSPRDTTLAEALFQRGYATMSVVSNAPFLGHGFGLDRGFEYLDARYEDDVRYSPRDALLQLGLGMPIVQRRRADEIEAESSALIRRAAQKRRPFFLFVNFMDAHAPYPAPRKWATAFPGRRSDADTERLVGDSMAEMLRGKPPNLAPAIRDHLISQYDGAIAFVDQNVGSLIATLKETGIWDDTIVIITSDHGEAFGDKGFIGHGYSLYQDAIRIPLVIKFPHQAAASARDEPVALTDLFATILEATATTPSHPHFGLSLSGPLPPSRVVFSEGFTTVKDRNGVLRAAVTSRYKLIEEPGTAHFFDLVDDPDEHNDLAAHAPSVSRQLHEGIAGLAALQPHNQAGRKIDPETERRLRALGYIH